MGEQALVKVCGLRSLENALECVEAGVHMLGFNFYPESKRFVAFEEASEWLGALEGVIERVGLFVNAERTIVRRVMESGLIDVAQFHGDETAEDCAFFAAQGFRFMKAFRVAGEGSVADVRGMSTDRVLLDAFSAEGYGGTGETFDWSLARTVVDENPELRVMLSGGLHPRNVADAVTAVRPWAVDVASGVESAPGVKDADLVRRFVDGALH